MANCAHGRRHGITYGPGECPECAAIQEEMEDWEEARKEGREPLPKTVGGPSGRVEPGDVLRMITTMRWALFYEMYEHTDNYGMALIEIWEKWRAEHIQGPHCGDCTNQPCPCIRCHIEMIEEEAQKDFDALKARSARESSSGTIPVSSELPNWGGEGSGEGSAA